jgi:hypothetical protein
MKVDVSLSSHDFRASWLIDFVGGILFTISMDGRYLPSHLDSLSRTDERRTARLVNDLEVSLNLTWGEELKVSEL